MSSIVISIDQGTTSSRCIAFRREGTIVSQHNMEHKQITPHPGWLEHDPEEIVQNVESCLKKVLKDVNGLVVAGAGVTNQRETTVAWRRSTSKPLCNAIVWSDSRTQAIVDTMSERFGGHDFSRDTCGLPCSTYFSAVKMKWMLENVPAVRDAADEADLCFGTIDSYLIWRLTNGRSFVTDVTNASRTMLMSLQHRQWDPTMCHNFGVDVSWLPRIASSSEILGVTTVDSHQIVIAGCIGDQQAALVGHGCFAAGTAKNTFGTGCFLLVNSGTTIPVLTSGLLATVAFQLGANAPCFYAV